MSTIEQLSNNIDAKFVGVADVFSYLDDENIKYNEMLKNRFDDILAIYKSESSPILVRYYKEKNGAERTGNHLDDFYKMIDKHNMPSKLNTTCTELKKAVCDYRKESKKVDAMIKKFNVLKINRRMNIEKYDMCNECSIKMTPNPYTSEMKCSDCGSTSKMTGTVFEDDQFYSQEGHRTKRGNYETAKHGKSHLEKAQAREPTPIPERICMIIAQCAVDAKIGDVKNIKCSRIRSFLQEKKLSAYYVHVPKIRKVVFKITPPQLSDKEFKVTLIFFDIMIKIFEQIKPDGKTNCPYHPFFLYKCLEQVVDRVDDLMELADETDDDSDDSDSDDEICEEYDKWLKKSKKPMLHYKSKKKKTFKKKRTLPAFSIRKKKILSCFHLQAQETLVANDLLFEKICALIPEFIYKPTDKAIHNTY